MTKCMMIDLETLSTKANAVVLSVGYVIFDRTHSQYLELMCSETLAELDSQFKAGRHIDSDTLAWWSQQDEKAKYVFAPKDHTKAKLEDIIMSLSFAYKNYGCEEVWSKGARF